MPQPAPTIVNDPFAPRLALTYAAFFAVIGWHLPLFPVWLAARGLDPVAIGAVLAAMQAVRAFATPAGTRIADRYGSLRAAIVATALASVVAVALLGNANGFTVIFIAAVVLAFVSAPMLPLTDAYGLKGLAQRGKSYGPVRLWGSVAFIAANLTGGLLLDALAPGNLIWVIFAGNCALAVAAMLLVPEPRDPAAAPSAASRGHSHLRRPIFLAIAAAGSLIQASHAVYYGFATLDWTAKGFDGVTIGVLWALGVAAEIVLFAFAGRLTLSPITLMLIGAAGGIARWVAMTFDPPSALLFPLQFLHALSFGATHLGTMMFLSRNAPEGSRAAAQGDIATANSVMMAAASALAGVLYGAGGGLAYAAMAVLAATGGVFAFTARVLGRQASSSNGKRQSDVQL